MARDSSALLDIVEAINRALNFAHGLDRDQFLMDETRHWAIYSQIVIIGEATTKLSSELRNANPHIPWKTMIGMRHRLVHGYNAISWDRVWETVVDDLPELLLSIEALLPAENM